MATTPKTKTVEVEVTTRTLPHVRHPSLAAALAAFQAELPELSASTDGQAGTRTYKYANLGDISPTVLRLLGKHGLSWTTRPTLLDGQFVLVYKLMHESGDAEEGVYPLALGAPQNQGMLITYARRYALGAVTGVAAAEDDDDAASVPPTAPQAPPQAQGPQQARPAKAAPRKRDWLADAAAAVDKADADALWAEARAEVQAGNATNDLLDAIAGVWRARKEAAAQETAGEPEDADSGGAAAAAAHEAEPVLQEAAQAEEATA